MQRESNTKSTQRWRRKPLAQAWQVSERTIDRMARDAKRLGKPAGYFGRVPFWTDEQKQAAEQRHAAPPAETAE
jgi:hypothetical protein